MRSMTGFGEASIERDGVFVSVDVSTVNSRHHDINVNLTHYPKFQRRVEKAVRDRIERGKVDVQFHSNMIGTSEETVHVDDDMVEFYVTEADRLSDDYSDVDGDIDADDLMELPGVLNTESEPILEDRAEELFLEALGDALDGVVEMREKEGDSIASDLKERVEGIYHTVQSIRDRIPKALDRYRDKFRQEIEDALDLPDDEMEERLENEMKKYADKCDISEEVVRLESHLDQFEEYLEEDGTVGKNLEFLIQEIQREINTVGAKGNDAEISQLAVDVKSELEKCREQVKNVE